ncbi:TPA: hypothetical protein ACXI8Y_000767 [Pseudomonas aeruginosa]
MIIERRRADFSRQIAGKRRYIETKWRDQGVAESLIEAALEVLQDLVQQAEVDMPQTVIESLKDRAAASQGELSDA